MRLGLVSIACPGQRATQYQVGFVRFGGDFERPAGIHESLRRNAP